MQVSQLPLINRDPEPGGQLARLPECLALNVECARESFCNARTARSRSSRLLPATPNSRHTVDDASELGLQLACEVRGQLVAWVNSGFPGQLGGKLVHQTKKATLQPGPRRIDNGRRGWFNDGQSDASHSKE
jgi:hypothetical protein